MITDGGPHPAEVWAQVTAEHIAPIGPDVTGHRRLAALALQANIATAIEQHHQSVMDVERSKLAADPNHIVAPVDPGAHLDAAVAAVQEAAKGTEWEDHFADPDDGRTKDGKVTNSRLALIRQEIGTHFATVQHIEKSWHADKNPSHPAALAFRAQNHPVTAEN